MYLENRLIKLTLINPETSESHPVRPMSGERGRQVIDKDLRGLPFLIDIKNLTDKELLIYVTYLGICLRTGLPFEPKAKDKRASQFRLAESLTIEHWPGSSRRLEFGKFPDGSEVSKKDITNPLIAVMAMAPELTEAAPIDFSLVLIYLLLPET